MLIIKNLVEGYSGSLFIDAGMGIRRTKIIFTRPKQMPLSVGAVFKMAKKEVDVLFVECAFKHALYDGILEKYCGLSLERQCG